MLLPVEVVDKRVGRGLVTEEEVGGGEVVEEGISREGDVGLLFEDSPRLEGEKGIGLAAVRLGGDVCDGAICANFWPNIVKNRVIEGCRDCKQD